MMGPTHPSPCPLSVLSNSPQHLLDAEKGLPKKIFTQNITPPVAKYQFPDVGRHLKCIRQLVYCLSLLAAEQSNDRQLDQDERRWLEYMIDKPHERERLQAIATNLIRAFIRDEVRQSAAVKEIVCLAPALGQKDFKKLLEAFVDGIRNSMLQDGVLLDGLEQLIRNSSLANFDVDDLLKVLALLHDRWQDNSDPYLVLQAAYAIQALVYMRDDETRVQAKLRRSGNMMKGISAIVSALKVNDPDSIQEGLLGANVASHALQANNGKNFYECIKEAFNFDNKSIWYPALRSLDSLIQDARFAEFEKLIREAPCQMDPAYQWGVCQRLGEIANNPLWDTNTCKCAVRFLMEIYEDDTTTWGEQVNVKQWILHILTQSESSPDKGIAGYSDDIYVSPKVTANIQATGSSDLLSKAQGSSWNEETAEADTTAAPSDDIYVSPKFTAKIQATESSDLLPKAQESSWNEETAETDTMVTLPSTYQSTYNILISGEIQSGKSTLIQGIRRYVDPTCQIDKSTIGGGKFSHTQVVRTTEVTTNLPPYYVYEMSKEDGEKYPVDYDGFIKMEKEDYEDAINKRKGYELSQGIPTSDQPERKFKLIDTPGLGDTENFDEIHVSSILKALKDIQDVHLVLITVSNNAISDGAKDAIKSYVNILPNFKGVLAFVHTRVSYKDLHPSYRRFIESMEEKKKILGEIANTRNVPYFMIDYDLECTRPIQARITQSTIRNILSLAPFNQPVRVETMTLNKTPKMSEVDMFLKEKYETVIEARGTALEGKDKAQVKVLETIGNLKASIGEKEGKIRDVVHNLLLHETNEMVLFDQKRFEEDWSPLEITKTHEVRMDCAPHLIDHLDIMAHNVKIKKAGGGRGAPFWEAKFQRNRYQHGIFHAKVYIKKRKMFEKEIQPWKRDNDRLPGEIEELQEKLQDYMKENQDYQAEIRELLE
ncbi:hypothetical protein BGZ80_009776 [Entomortierella chlamydospora]|uniref:Arm-like repeat domain-containing protein n=1 Tax=Entomortierella chlamydospora TaxID=101097 RepID=A0A9P6MWD1_9FUNG|nr:hypothetical protein BGZ80_009776 [Entomortierella chlamydospora]